MPFTDSCRKIRLDGSTLVAECRTNDGSSYKESRLPLDPFIGNIEGAFKWGGADFSKSAREISLKTSILSAELQNTGRQWLKATLDLNTNIENKDGVLRSCNIPTSTLVAAAAATLTPSPVKPAPLKGDDAPLKLDTVKPMPPPISRAASSESNVTTAVEDTQTRSSYFGSVTGTTTTTTSPTTIIKKVTRTRTMTMSFDQSCRKLEIKGGILSAECLLADGCSWKTSTFDLDRYIGNIDGTLTWEKQDFSKSSQNIRIEGTKLVAECKRASGKEYGKASYFDLATRLRCDNGVIVVIAYDEKFSTMLSEVPWMKFKVVAEPDFSVIATHPVMQTTMAKIAESTVHHVTEQFASIMALAIAAAVETVTASAMEHISQSIEVMVQGVTKSAHVERSATDPRYLSTAFSEGLSKAPVTKELVL